jgi:hypothetical protein
VGGEGDVARSPTCLRAVQPLILLDEQRDRAPTNELRSGIAGGR